VTFPAPDRASWRVVPLLMAIVFISHFNRISMSVAGDTRIMPEYGISPTRMGWVYSIFILIYTLNMTPAGIFADRKGTWIALAVMLLGTGTLGALTGVVGLVATGAGTIWISLLVVRAVMGFLTSPLHPSAARTVASWVPVNRVILANGWVVAMAGLGIAGTFTLFHALIERFDWQGAFLVSGGVTVAIGVLWLLLGGDTATARRARRVPASAGVVAASHGSRPGAPPFRWTHLLKNPSLLLLTLSYAAVGYFQYLFFFWMHYYFDTVLALGASESNLYSTIPLLAFTAGMPAGGWIGDRLGMWLHARRAASVVPFAGMLLGALGLGAGVLARDPIAIVACFSVALFGIGATEPFFWTSAVNLGGVHGTTAAGILNTGGNGGGFLAPVVTPALSAQFGWEIGLGFGALVCLAGALSWRWIKMPEQPSARNPGTAKGGGLGQ
jgi:MFS family permease